MLQSNHIPAVFGGAWPSVSYVAIITKDNKIISKDKNRPKGIEQSIPVAIPMLDYQDESVSSV